MLLLNAFSGNFFRISCPGGNIMFVEERPQQKTFFQEWPDLRWHALEVGRPAVTGSYPQRLAGNLTMGAALLQSFQVALFFGKADAIVATEDASTSLDHWDPATKVPAMHSWTKTRVFPACVGHCHSSPQWSAALLLWTRRCCQNQCEHRNRHPVRHSRHVNQNF